MTPVALRLARLLASRRGEVGEIACALLEAEGFTVDAEAETPAERSSRAPMTAAERQAKRRLAARVQRDNVTDGVTDVTNVTADVTVENVTCHAVRDSRDLSLSSLSTSSNVADSKETFSVDQKEKRGRSARAGEMSRVTRHADSHASRDVTSVTQTISRNDPLPDELRAAAEIIGVRDVDTAWTKFVGKNDGRTGAIAGWWQAWCADERAFEQKRAFKASAAANPSPPKEYQPPESEEPPVSPAEAAANADALIGSLAKPQYFQKGRS